MVKQEGTQVSIEMQCPSCKKQYKHGATALEYIQYKKGKDINEAFPTMHIDFKELLINKIYCGECFDNMFAKEEFEEADYE